MHDLLVLRRNIYLIPLVVVIILYLSVSIFYSIDIVDSGFVLSLVGRLSLNQEIYKDFDYVRPFETPILWHNLLGFFPTNFPYLIIICRILVILQAVFSSYLAAKIMDVKHLKFYVIIFTVSILHIFPIMPWHTLDGIMFSLISIYLLKKKLYASAIAIALFAALTKQSFYPFCLIMWPVTLYLWSRNFVFYKKDIYLFLSLVFIFCLILIKYNIIQNFSDLLSQLDSSSSGETFLNVAVFSFFFANIYLNIIFVSIILTLLFYPRLTQKVIFYIISILMLLFYISFLTKGNYFYVNQLSLLLFVVALRFTRNIYIYLLFLVSWCSAISWGYNIAIFLLLVLFVSFFHNLMNKKKVIFFSFTIVFIMSIARILYPYGSQSVKNVKYEYVSNMPVISGLWITKSTYEYFNESLQLEKKYKSVVFLPANPLIDVMTNKFPGRASWEMDIENPTYKKYSYSKPAVFVIDRRPFVNDTVGFYKSSITNRVVLSKNKIDSTKFFIIYK